MHNEWAEAVPGHIEISLSPESQLTAVLKSTHIVTDFRPGLEKDLGMPPKHAYFLNTDYLKLVVHKDANLKTLDEVRPYNQDAAVIPILWQGNLTCSNRQLQGVMIDTTP